MRITGLERPGTSVDEMIESGTTTHEDKSPGEGAGIPHAIFHLTTFCCVQIEGLFEVLEGMVSREESSSLARFLWCPLPLGEPSLKRSCLRMGMTSIPVGISGCLPGGSQSSTQPRWLRAWWEQRLGTPSWVRALQGLPPYSPCLSISLSLCLFSTYPRTHSST